jgi:putative transcriptional regulator
VKNAFLALVLFLSLPGAGHAESEGEVLPSLFLIASRDLRDPNFRETVVLATRVGPAPFGVIINRPTGLPLSDLFPEFERLDRKRDYVYFGGPVERRTLVFLFRAESPPADDALEVLPRVYFSASLTLLRELLKREHPTIGLRVFAGHSGWAAGQLEAEISVGGWRLAPADAATIFDKDTARIWPELIDRGTGQMVRSGWMGNARPARR